MAQTDRKSLQERIGNIEQLFKLRTVVAEEGRGRGVRLVEADNGNGLAFSVMADRALDLYDVRYKGIPLAWLSPNGIVNPAFYEPEGVRWLRSWPGGMLTTAGFLNVGGPVSVGGEDHGLHGRAANLPAEQLSARGDWQGDDYVMEISGLVRHTMTFGEKIVMRRRVVCSSRENAIAVTDRIENQGYKPTPLMMLYHCNFGYPLLDDGARLEAREHRIEPKDETAAAGLADWMKMEAPQVGYAEQVLTHSIPADADGFARIHLVNPALGLKLTVAYEAAALPYLNEWKQMGQGEYVVGLEPGNCIPIGQTANAERGILRMLAPGETADFQIKVSVAELK